jgi:hypothetical protein
MSNIEGIDASALPRRRANSYTNSYANHIEIRGNLADTSIVFSEIVDGALIEEKCRIAMSPLQAKMLVVAMSTHIAKWEKAFGWTIPNTPESRAALEILELQSKSTLPDEPTEPEPQP